MRFQRAVLGGPSEMQVQRLREEISATGRFPSQVVAEIERAVEDLHQFPGQQLEKPAINDAGGSSAFEPVESGHLTGHAQPQSDEDIALWGCDAVLCLLSNSQRDLHQVT